MSKIVSFDSTEKILKGLNIAANAVGGTLGPKGRNVYIDNSMTPKITNDGHTIADQIVLEDKLENLGAYLVRNTSAKTNDDVGDGTSTTAVLLQAIIHECLKRPENPMEIRASLKKAGEKVLKLLAKQSIKITKKDIEKVALISAENKELAEKITSIFNKLGERAVVNVEDSKTFTTEIEIVNGYEANVGFMSPAFINDKRTARAIYEDIDVFVTEKKIGNITDLAPLFNKLKEENIGKCVIVCEDIDDSMLGVFVRSKLMGTFDGLVIKATGPLLADIEGVVGATAVSDSSGITFATVELSHLGKAKKVVSDQNKTLFLGNSRNANEYALLLERRAENEPNMFSKEKLEDRIAKLRGGVAILKIGAPTDFERDDLSLKAEDAVKAVQAALAEGVVEGGGMALWRIAMDLRPKTIGEEILKKTLTAPLRKIIENAGKDYAEVVRELPEGQGYNAKEDIYVDMIQTGIIDPSKVERCAVENSISTASEFITSFAAIVDYVPNETK